MSPKELITALTPAVLEAGKAILAIRGRGFDVTHKDDKSPVTEADQAAEDILIKALRKLVPDAVIVAEELAAAGIMPDSVGQEFWLIDPLDGTKEFVRGGADFTVNIALIKDGRPALGVVYAPAQDRLFSGIVDNGAWEGDKPLNTRQADLSALDVVASKSHRDAETDKFLKRFSVRDLKSAGSSLKFCLVAAGEADIYPRFGPTMEWDTAAGHAVLAAAGGQVVHPDGQSYGYAKPDFKNGPFIAVGDAAILMHI